MSTVRTTITVSIQGPEAPDMPQSYTLVDSRTTGDDPLYYVRTARESITRLQEAMDEVIAVTNGDIDTGRP